MNREEIIQMAEECGIPEFENNESQAENIMRFAALVASTERERLAKVFDELDKGIGFYDPHEPAEIIRGQA
jgi:hypothetical protein